MKLDYELFDSLTKKAQESKRLRMHFDLRNSENDSSMRMLNALEPGTLIPIHRHLDTSEDVVVLRGEVEEIFYDSHGNETSRYRLKPGSDCMACHIPIRQYHTCVSLKSGSVIIEFKDGKYNKDIEDLL